MDTEAGLNLLQNLQLGVDEISWFQSNTLRRTRSILLSLYRPGLCVERTVDGQLDTAWRVSDDNDDGTVDIGVSGDRLAGGDVGARMVGPTGELAVLTEDEADFPLELVLTNDNVWRTIIATPVTSEYELGTISVSTGSAVVTGTGTQFTRFAGYTSDGFDRGSLLQISGSSNGNDGDYEIDSIASDGSLTLRNAVAGTNEAGLQFKIVGDFAVAPGGTTPTAHIRRGVELQVAARTREAPAGSYVVADVKRNDALVPKVAIIDRREGSRLRRRTGKAPHGAVTLQPKITWSAKSATAIEREVYQADTQAADYTGVGAITGTSDGGLAMIWHEAGTVLAKPFDPTNLTWGGGSTVDAVATVTKRPAIIQLPTECGKTHIAFYTNDAAGNAETRFSDDDTALWSGAAIAWNPQTEDPNDYLEDLDALLLQNHRIILVGTYYDDSATAKSIRYVYSDDYGDSWQTNGGAGWELMTDSDDLGYPRIDQQPNGTIWMVAENTTSSTIIMDRSTGSDLPDPDDPTGFAEVSPSNASRPVVHADEEAVLLGYIEDASPDSIVVANITEDADGALGLSYYNNLFFSATDTAELDWWHGRDGQLHVMHADNDSATRYLFHVPCMVVTSRTQNTLI